MFDVIARSTRIALLLALSFADQAMADDLADEADLHFERGAEAYQRGDYATALEKFLISNRIVPNRNVVFNIARCYELLGKAAQAYRAYDQARSGETDPQVLASIDAELQRIGTKVSVLSVSSNPPGATIYVERRDLGPRGVTPRRLALAPGEYRVIVDMPGYASGQLDSGKVALGENKEIQFELQPILGKVVIQSDSSTSVVADDPKTGAGCRAPCELTLSLGFHTLHFTRPAHHPLQMAVEVTKHRPSRVVPVLGPQTGSVVISTDEPGALVEIDGHSKGFTPLVASLPVGEHRVRITLNGFQPIERKIEVLADKQQRIQLELIQSERVEGAARRVESVQDTPSSVSIVPQVELTALAYPTLAEALRGLPGIYFWDDRGYIGVGMRGLGRLNSYGNRVLVLVDGVPTNDNWLGSSYVGYDALTDLSDVERIELVRGPGSAVYGTGAFSGVINVITRRETNTGVEAGISTNLDAVARTRVRVNLRKGPNTGLYLSAAMGRSVGRDFYLPELASAEGSALSPDAASGWARGLDSMRVATLRGRGHHGIWSLQWLWNSHEKLLPNAPFDTVFGDARTRQFDERGFVELRVEPRLSASTTTVSSVTLNRYRFRGDYAHAEVDGGLEIDTYRGHWVTFGERLVHAVSSRLGFTLGGEASWHFDVKQKARDDSSTYLDTSNPYRVLAGYAILDGQLGANARVSLGSRIDNYSTFGTSFNPRIGLVIKPYDQGNTKFTAGRAFRAPSVYELWYNDGGITQKASPNLTPETMLSAEVEHSHRFSPTVIGSAAVYANAISNLIDTVGEGNSVNPIHFVVTKKPIVALGTEIGLRREWRSGWMVSAHYGYTRARFLRNDEFSTLLAFDRDPNVRRIANSPTHSATLKGLAPFLVRGLSLGTRLALEDGRWDRYESKTDPTQNKTQAAVFWDLVLSMQDARHHLRGALGVYNLFDWRYQYPVGSESPLQRTMSSSGRTLLVSLEARY